MSFIKAIMGSCYAPDGGLYYQAPADIPRFTKTELDSLRRKSLNEVARAVVAKLLDGELPEKALDEIFKTAFSFEIPVTKIMPNHYVAELYHAHTGSFKDARGLLMAPCYSVIATFDLNGVQHTVAGSNGHIFVIVVSTGDTAPAIAKPFHGRPGVTVILLYQEGRVSDYQQYQMASLGDNVYACPTKTDFDHNQQMLNTGLKDPDLAGQITTGNSINYISQLAQVVFSLWSYLQVTESSSEVVTMSVPTGNMGNLAACRKCQLMGVPIKPHAATNINSPLKDYLDTGFYEARKSVKTLSSAMDVGNPNNFARVRALYENHSDMSLHLSVSVTTNEQIKKRMARVHGVHGYLTEPHTVVGIEGSERELRPHLPSDRKIITMATAAPYKFGDTIKEILGFAPDLPEKDLGWQDKPLYLHPLLGDYDEFKEFILRLPRKSSALTAR